MSVPPPSMVATFCPWASASGRPTWNEPPAATPIVPPLPTVNAAPGGPSRSRSTVVAHLEGAATGHGGRAQHRERGVVAEQDRAGGRERPARVDLGQVAPAAVHASQGEAAAISDGGRAEHGERAVAADHGRAGDVERPARVDGGHVQPLGLRVREADLERAAGGHAHRAAAADGEGGAGSPESKPGSPLSPTWKEPPLATAAVPKTVNVVS